MSMRIYECKSVLVLTLLFMILMRLVWMDLRSYPPYYPAQNKFVVSKDLKLDPCMRSFEGLEKSASIFIPQEYSRPSWGNSFIYRTMIGLSCRGQAFDEQVFIRYNQGLLISLVFAAALLARIVSRSWILSLIIAVALLSRGRLIAANGVISPEFLLSSLLLFWATSFGHYLRSASLLILLFHLSVIVAMSLLDPSFLPLFAVIPMLWLISRTRGWSQVWDGTSADSFWNLGRQVPRWFEMFNIQPLVRSVPAGELDAGHVFSPIAGGLGSLLSQPKGQAAFRLQIGWMSLLVVGFFALTFASKSFPSLPIWPTWETDDYIGWGKAVLVSTDLDLVVAAVFILLTLIFGSNVVQGLRALSALTLLGFGGSMASCFLWDRVYLPASAFRYWQGQSLLLIWEPLLLTIGMLGFFSLFFELVQKFVAVFRSTSVAKKV